MKVQVGMHGGGKAREWLFGRRNGLRGCHDLTYSQGTYVITEEVFLVSSILGLTNS